MALLILQQGGDDLYFYMNSMPHKEKKLYERMCSRAMHTMETARVVEHAANQMIAEIEHVYFESGYMPRDLQRKYMSLCARHANLNLEAHKQLYESDQFLSGAKLFVSENLRRRSG